MTNPCSLQYSICGTGVAGGDSIARSWYCASNLPKGSQPNAVGIYCFDSLENCAAGPNACNVAAPCGVSLPQCQSGLASADALRYSTFCASSVPPNSLQNGAGTFCYATAEACYAGPNVCTNGTAASCERNPVMCSTGPSGGSYTWWCPADLPTGAVPTSSGRLCYDVNANCAAGRAPSHSSAPTPAASHPCAARHATSSCARDRPRAGRTRARAAAASRHPSAPVASPPPPPPHTAALATHPLARR